MYFKNLAFLSCFSFMTWQCVKCKVVKKTNSGIDVELDHSAKPAFIPRMHLSDSVELCNALWERLKVGDVIDQAMYWNKMKVAVSFQCIIEVVDLKQKYGEKGIN